MGTLYPTPTRPTIYDPGYLTLENGQRILIDPGNDGALLLEVTPQLPLNPVPCWRLDGNAFPRNPIQFDVKWDKANVSYEPLADGRQIRMATPYIMRGADVTIAWDKADRRTYNFIMQYINPNYTYPAGAYHTLLLDGISPPKIAHLWIDTPEIKMSKDNVIRSRSGEGNVLNDITLTARMGAYFKSYFAVPNALSGLIQTNVYAMFAGPTQTYMDNVPLWKGNYWNQCPNDGNSKIKIENLGTAPWSPKLRINGPFTSVSVNSLVDVDGTGEGVVFTWTGRSLFGGEYILFDIEQKRCYLQAETGALTEVYSFTVTTVSDGNSFMFFPPMNPGVNTFEVSTNGFLPGISSFDFSNGGTNHFNYW